MRLVSIWSILKCDEKSYKKFAYSHNKSRSPTYGAITLKKMHITPNTITISLLALRSDITVQKRTFFSVE